MNPFTHDSSAARYAQGRPYFHPLVMNRIGQLCAAPDPLHVALDVGCGTGLSARALLDISCSVFALDSSPHMLALVPADPRVHRILAECEQIPLRSRSVDLVTAASVIHWVDRERFLSEAARVLKPRASLVVYDNFFMADQRGIPGFRAWFEQEYLRRYPSPRRDLQPLDDANRWRKLGFALDAFERFEHDEPYTAERFVDYLVTQSNVIAAVENGDESLASVRGWLNRSLLPFFQDSAEQLFRYNGPIAILRPLNTT